jgi:transcriptional regulator of acetoin/glycerol metabolism
MGRVGEGPDTATLLRLFPRTVEVPPLRLHLGDMPSLVSFFLGQLGPSGHLSCSPEAMGTLERGTWPGNARQVLEVLREVVRHRRTGAIQPDDLPPSVRSVSRRHLNLIEAMQRDAVVRALTDAGGDKTRAARSLGMSRATIYRKIHDYGIVLSPR